MLTLAALLCLLARLLAWGTACSGHQQPPLRADQARHTLRRLRRAWYGQVAVAASMQPHGTAYVKSRSQRNGAAQQGIRRGDRVRRSLAWLLIDGAGRRLLVVRR